MTANITFSRYSEDKEFNNLYVSNKIMDEILEESNNIIFRVPENLEKIDNLILCFDGQNLFDPLTSHFGTIFDLDKIIRNFENQSNENFLIIGITSNSKRQIQYNPYLHEEDINFASIHIENIVSKFLPSVSNFLEIKFDLSKLIVAGASMGGLMSIKTSIMYPQFENIISLSPAFWFGYPKVVEDIKNLNEKSATHLYTGKKEGHIFGKHVKDIFPNEWDLDFSNNDDFYFSGVQKIYEAFQLNNKNINFTYDENGMHNESSWATALLKIFLNL